MQSSPPGSPKRRLIYQSAYGNEPVFDRSAPGPAPVGVLQGIPGSPGIATGLVQHIRSQNDFAGIQDRLCPGRAHYEPGLDAAVLPRRGGRDGKWRAPVARCGHRPRDRHPGRHGDPEYSSARSQKAPTVTVNGTEGHVKPM